MYTFNFVLRWCHQQITLGNSELYTEKEIEKDTVLVMNGRAVQ